MTRGIASPRKDALLVIDVQEDVINDCVRGDEVIQKINTLVGQAREAGTPVIWVQHSSPYLPRGSSGWQLHHDLLVDPSEPVIHKIHGDTFEGTDLSDVLDARDVNALIVAGSETDACVRSTIHGAFTRGYSMTLVGDAHTTSDKQAWGAPDPEAVIAHTNLYWSFMTAPGRSADVLSAGQVRF